MSRYSHNMAKTSEGISHKHHLKYQNPVTLKEGVKSRYSILEIS